MALTPEIQAESDLAKAKILKNENLTDDDKKHLMSIVNITASATNGITPEEKIQRMTEAMHMMVNTFVSMMSSLNDNFQKVIKQSNKSQCETCHAMKYVQDATRQQHTQQVQDRPKPDSSARTDKLFAFLKDLLLTPWPWIVICISVVSPYGLPIIKEILGFLHK